VVPDPAVETQLPWLVVLLGRDHLDTIAAVGSRSVRQNLANPESYEPEWPYAQELMAKCADLPGES
jgi:hypothetical protein